ncbi:MAG: hypothetical protein ABW089_09100 [Sedimenticola sp.]
MWAKRVIEGLPGERDLSIWFDDGDDPIPDVSEWQAAGESLATLQPLARVMDSHWVNGLVYRNHRIPRVDGSTRANLLSQALSKEVEQLHADDSVWLLFNGHGGRGPDLNNTLELWDRTSLHVNQLADLLDQAPTQSRLRFLFTQCYSGAFAALARPGTQRCGFMAEASDRKAEGCSAAIGEEDFEDYSTHFFAALSGRSRDGSPLSRNPDQDNDGVVTPLEAHYHTLVTASSTDIPLATSEVLLAEWQPWYLPLAAFLSDGFQTLYGDLARELMVGAGIQDKSAIALRRIALKAQHKELEKRRMLSLLEGEVRTLRESMKEQLLRRWPEVAHPYTHAFQRFLVRDIESAQAFILDHPDYFRLVKLQAELRDLELRLLDLERTITRLDKIDHLLHLDRVLVLMRALGSENLERRYDNLLQCENEPF